MEICPLLDASLLSDTSLAHRLALLRHLLGSQREKDGCQRAMKTRLGGTLCGWTSLEFHGKITFQL